MIDLARLDAVIALLGHGQTVQVSRSWLTQARDELRAARPLQLANLPEQKVAA